MEKKYTTENFKETQKLGEDFARCLSSPRKRGSRADMHTLDSRLHGNDKHKEAVVLALQGNLGGGKTTFLQGFAKGLGIKEKILSPTFVIMKRFVIPASPVIPAKAGIQFFHIDCYRLKNENDILELGFKEIISNPKNIIAIEWPEKIKKLLPKDSIIIKFKFIDQNKREINFKI